MTDHEPKNTDSYFTTHNDCHRVLVGAVMAGLTLVVGCSDDEGGGGATGGTGGNGTGGVATGGQPAGGGGSGTTKPLDYAALIRGELFTDDLADAQAVHDGIAAGGEDTAKMLGDFGHDALLGTTLLGTQENAFLGLDRWDNTDGLNALYSDPDFQAAFGQLFAAPPTVETFARYGDWVTWGELTSGDSFDPHWFVVVRGRLAGSDTAASREAHNMVATGGEEPAKMLGDVAHVPMIGLDDPREFLSIDIWSDDQSIETFYTDPAFAEAFGPLFEGPATIGVYESTDWHQW